MKPKYLFLFVMLAVPFLIFQKPVNKHSSDHIEGEIMVMLKSSKGHQQEQAIDLLLQKYAHADARLIKEISSRMNIWLIKIDPSRSSEDKVLASLRADDQVVL